MSQSVLRNRILGTFIEVSTSWHCDIINFIRCYYNTLITIQDTSWSFHLLPISRPDFSPFLLICMNLHYLYIYLSINSESSFSKYYSSWLICLMSHNTNEVNRYPTFGFSSWSLNSKVVSFLEIFFANVSKSCLK